MRYHAASRKNIAGKFRWQTFSTQSEPTTDAQPKRREPLKVPPSGPRGKSRHLGPFRCAKQPIGARLADRVRAAASGGRSTVAEVGRIDGQLGSGVVGIDLGIMNMQNVVLNPDGSVSGNISADFNTSDLTWSSTNSLAIGNVTLKSIICNYPIGSAMPQSSALETPLKKRSRPYHASPAPSAPREISPG
jgi:hypothetical protein